MRERAHAFVDRARTAGRARSCLPALAAHGIRIARVARDSTTPTRPRSRAFFRDAVLPVLTPLAIDVSRPFPLLSSLSLNLALLLEPARRGRRTAGWRSCRCPSGLAASRRVAGSEDVAFVLLEDVIRAHLAAALSRARRSWSRACIRLARDAELELDDEGGRTQLELVEREVRRRRRSDVVRLEIEATASDELVATAARAARHGRRGRLSRRRARSTCAC